LKEFNLPSQNKNQNSGNNKRKQNNLFIIAIEKPNFVASINGYEKKSICTIG